MNLQPDPFAPENNGGVTLKRPTSTKPRPMKIKWKLKGNKDGNIYAGTKLIVGCRSCKKV